MGGAHFSDPGAVASYLEGPPRMVPGLAVLHQLVDQILAEKVPDDGRVLVVGAGGGLELAYLAGRHPSWRFDGVDPSRPMLELARKTMGSLASRATLHEGYVDTAPAGPFDGATVLLTLHFLPPRERLHVLEEIRRRLRPGAPLLAFHHSVVAGPTRKTWLARFARFAGRTPEESIEVADSFDQRLPLLSPAEDEALMVEAGFSTVQLFYAALTFRGWLGFA